MPISHSTLLQALKASVKPSGGPSNGGLDNQMWAAVVDRTGVVQAVCYSGIALGDQWPGSRAIAIEKANTANALSLPGFAFSTANLYSGAQPGGFLYGILETNPVDTASMYGGDTDAYGLAEDPMVGRKASGVVVFGGGLALYDGSTIVGGLGVSGDLSKRGNSLRVMAEAVRWGKRGARVNTISPGIIITPLANDELKGPRGPGYRSMIEASAAGRAGTPDEVGNVGALLMGEDGAFITGSDFLMDGGVTAAWWYGDLAPK
jgi:uncharacterized protein GlcG (DUF336 family)